MQRKWNVKIAAYLVLSFAVCYFAVSAAEVMRGASSSANPLVRHIIRERENAVARTRLDTINILMPPMEMLADVILRVPSSRQEQEKFFREQPLFLMYFTKIVEYAPSMAEGHAMMGYCYYRIGKIENAVEAFSRSAALNGQFFWTSHNLAVIHFQKGDYDQAMFWVSRALESSEQATAQTIIGSKIFRDILMTPTGQRYDPQQQWQEGRRRLAQLAASMIQSKQTGIAPQQSFDIQVF